MDGIALRALALDALGPHDPPRAAEILAAATVTLDPDTQAWTASTGTVQGWRVQLALDAHALGTLRAAPAVLDAVCAACAHALGTRADTTLAALTLTWSGAVEGTDEPYRGAHPREGRGHLAVALANWLRGAGDPAAADLLAEATVTLHGEQLDVTTHRAPTPHARGAMQDAARALLDGGVSVIWRVKRG